MKRAMLSGVVLAMMSGLAMHVTAQAPRSSGGGTVTDGGEPLVKTNNVRLLEAAASYKQWTRVSNFALWAPTMCSTPAPTGVQESVSDDLATHGSKLYFLYASDERAYDAANHQISDDDTMRKDPEVVRSQLVGLTLVKESWTPVEVAKDSQPADGTKWPDDHARGADGKVYRTGNQGDLFMMSKLPAGASDTDEGWIYGVVSADGSKVLSSGRIESCMDCHEQAPFDRLFGQPWAREERERRRKAKESTTAR